MKSRKIYQCQSCPKSYTAKQNLALHVNKNHQNIGQKGLKSPTGPKDAKYSCDQCDKHTVQKKETFGTIYHKSTIQHTNQRHTCDQCGKQFKRREHLKRHTITEHTNTRYVCNQCGKQFKRIERLKEHQKKELYQHQIINCIFYHDFFLASNICTIR